MVRRYEFYVRVAETISHSFAALTREISFLPRVTKKKETQKGNAKQENTLVHINERYPCHS